MRLRRGAAVLLVVFGIGVSGGAGVDAAPENRLAGEKSPYLQLHAADPVDWYPWGPEALGKARREGKPIFLSIGYSTCHWCHVMHEESFSDAGIAALLNRSFVAIKVDREERPDLDRIYMAYLVSVSGGGWPMTLFLTPELVPFFGATYLPPDDHNGEPGLRTLVRGLAGLWTDDRDEALEVAQENMRLLERRAQALGGAATSADQGALHETWARLRASYDARFGGFGGAPKFPRPVALNFLLRYHARTDEPLAAELAAGTLHGMARGGIRDHLAGGFHRYATDSAWRVPHFEKMLYDQALIAAAYTEAHLVTGDADLGAVARETLDFVLRDMRGPSGAFISALDADSPAPAGRPGTEAGRSREGAYYVWTAREIEAVLGADAPAFAFHHGVEPGGNVPASLDERGELAGTNVLAIRHTLADTASRFKTTEARMAARLDAARRRLAAARAARPAPPRDDKVLAAWNGMMISALARGAQVFDDARYRQAAQAAAWFVESRLYDRVSGTLLRRFRDGDAAIPALTEDYAWLIAGLLDLYTAAPDVRWLTWAVRLQERQDALFRDPDGGGYFSTAEDAPGVLVRFKDNYDGAEPSANSVSAMNLLRLWQITGREAWRTQADHLLRAFATELTRAGTSVPQLAVALDFKLSTPRQIVVAGNPASPDTRAMLRLVHARFLPTAILLLADGGEGQQALARWQPSVGPMRRIGGKATMYVCENFICRLPTNDLAVAAALLDGVPVDLR